MTAYSRSPSPTLNFEEIDDIILFDSDSSSDDGHPVKTSVPSSADLLEMFQNADRVDDNFLNGTQVVLPLTPKKVNKSDPMLSTVLDTPSPTPDLSPGRRKSRKNCHVPRPMSPTSFVLACKKNNNNNNHGEVKVNPKPKVTIPKKVKSVQSKNKKFIESKKTKKAGNKKGVVKIEKKPKMKGEKSMAAIYAKENRDRKKLEFGTLQDQNERLNTTKESQECHITALGQKLMAMKSQLAELDRKNRAHEGLRTVFPSIHRLLMDTVMPRVMTQSTGPWTLECANWFSEVAIPPPPKEQQKLVPDRPFFSPRPSPYVNLMVSHVDRKIIVDYDPNFVSEFAEFANN